MRYLVLAQASALVVLAALLSACPKKDADVVPEPPPTATTAQPTGASDKAGAEAPAAPAATPAAAAPAATPAATPAAAAPAVKPKKKDDQGGW